VNYIYKVGIDFGTTSSSIALRKYDARSGEMETTVFDLELTSHLKKNMKSVVSYGRNGEVWVGRDAVIEASRNQITQNLVQRVKWYLENEEGASTFRKEYPTLPQEITPADVVAEIFKELYQRIKAETNIAEIQGVVLGVPVDFSDLAKRRLIEALAKSGFYRSLPDAIERTEFVSEPVAVALYYRERLKEAQRVLVFDFGGGSLDLTVMDLVKLNEHKEAPPDVVISKETLKMAGEKLTEKLFTQVFLPRYGSDRLIMELKLPNWDLSAEKIWVEMQKCEDGQYLAEKLEEAKIELSKKMEYRLNFDKGRLRVDMVITQSQFELAISEELQQVRQAIAKCLQSPAKRPLEPKEIDCVYLAGGSSLIPAVRRLLGEIFNPDKIIWDDYEKTMLSIVRGLAIFGCQAEGEKKVEDIVDSDYGIWDEGNNRVSVIIPRHTKIADTKVNRLTKTGFGKHYRAMEPGQTYITLPIYQNQMRLGVVDIPVESGSDLGRFQIFLEVDEKKGWCTVEVYDKTIRDWIKTPIHERQVAIQRR
jgi:hypothetical chaperone protein